MEGIKSDGRPHFRIGKDKIIEEKHFYYLLELCMSCGIFFKDKLGSPSGKWELRISHIFCLDTEQHRQVYRELWMDALLGKQEVFSRQNEPKHPSGIHEEGELKVLSLLYDSDEDVVADIESATNYIKTRMKVLEYE